MKINRYRYKKFKCLKRQAKLKLRFKFRTKVRARTITKAKKMRKNPTPAEKELWQHLRCRRAGGLRFKRQAVIYGYIADFYCPSRKLAVEVDGLIHSKRAVSQRDRLRTRHLRGFGIKVIRFTNGQVLANVSRVVQVIIEVADKR